SDATELQNRCTEIRLTPWTIGVFRRPPPAKGPHRRRRKIPQNSAKTAAWPEACAAAVVASAPDLPADLLRERRVEIRPRAPLRRSAHALIEQLGILADQNAPALGLDAIEDDLRRLCRRGRRLLEEAPRPLDRRFLDIGVAHLGFVDAGIAQAR